DGVNHEVRGWIEQRIARLGVVELLHGADLGGGVNQLQSLRHHRYLVTPHRALHRVELAVVVGDADLVEVDQRKGPDAAASQRFGGEGADTTDANDHHVFAHQTVQTGLREEPRRAV